MYESCCKRGIKLAHYHLTLCLLSFFHAVASPEMQGAVCFNSCDRKESTTRHTFFTATCRRRRGTKWGAVTAILCRFNGIRLKMLDDKVDVFCLSSSGMNGMRGLPLKWPIHKQTCVAKQPNTDTRTSKKMDGPGLAPPCQTPSSCNVNSTADDLWFCAVYGCLFVGISNFHSYARTTSRDSPILSPDLQFSLKMYLFEIENANNARTALCVWVCVSSMSSWCRKTRPNIWENWSMTRYFLIYPTSLPIGTRACGQKIVTGSIFQLPRTWSNSSGSDRCIL